MGDNGLRCNGQGESKFMNGAETAVGAPTF